MNGVFAVRKLMNVTVDHIKQYDNMFLVSLPKTVTGHATIAFTITGTFFNVVQKYLALRPANTKDNRLFVHHKCSRQPYHGLPIGKSKLCGMPRKIAKYLNLPKPDQYLSTKILDLI